MSSTHATPKRKTSVPADSRRDILQAALDILRTEGDVALTVRRVAAQAGCSTIGVYHWFGGKDGLVDAILLDGYRNFAAALQKAKPKDGPLGGLWAQGLAYRKWALANSTSYRVMFLQAVRSHEPSADAIEAGLVAYETLKSEVRREQLRGGISQTDTESVALAMWGLVHGLVSIQIAQAEPGSGTMNESRHKRAYEMGLQLLLKGFAAAE
jgi:AcrR family transcriptional regulator